MQALDHVTASKNKEAVIKQVMTKYGSQFSAEQKQQLHSVAKLAEVVS